jgi:hypothetical protein
MKTIMEAVMDRITIDTSIYEFTKEIKVRPTDKTIDAHCVYGLTTEYTFNKETDDFDEERHVLIEELLCRSSIAAKASGGLCSERQSVMPRSGIRVWRLSW